MKTWGGEEWIGPRPPETTRDDHFAVILKAIKAQHLTHSVTPAKYDCPWCEFEVA